MKLCTTTFWNLVLVKMLVSTIQEIVYFYKFVVLKFVLIKFMQVKDPLYSKTPDQSWRSIKVSRWSFRANLLYLEPATTTKKNICSLNQEAQCLLSQIILSSFLWQIHYNPRNWRLRFFGRCLQFSQKNSYGIKTI